MNARHKGRLLSALQAMNALTSVQDLVRKHDRSLVGRLLWVPMQVGSGAGYFCRVTQIRWKLDDLSYIQAECMHEFNGMVVELERDTEVQLKALDFKLKHEWSTH